LITGTTVVRVKNLKPTCMYVSLYVHMYVCMCVCTYVWTYVCMYEAIRKVPFKNLTKLMCLIWQFKMALKFLV